MPRVFKGTRWFLHTTKLRTGCPPETPAPPSWSIQKFHPTSGHFSQNTMRPTSNLHNQVTPLTSRPDPALTHLLVICSPAFTKNSQGFPSGNSTLSPKVTERRLLLDHGASIWNTGTVSANQSWFYISFEVHVSIYMEVLEITQQVSNCFKCFTLQFQGAILES